MSPGEILAIAAGLAMDAFAVSLAAGATGMASAPRPIFRHSFHFGLFQFFMPVLGWYAGSRVAHLITGVDHWIAFGLLAFVGMRMIRSGSRGKDTTHRSDPSRGLNLIMLSLATSIDALAIGFSLALLDVNIWYPSVVIGLVTSGLSLIGLKLGSRLSAKFGRQMELVGGMILIAIGTRIVIEHLAA